MAVSLSQKVIGHNSAPFVKLTITSLTLTHTLALGIMPGPFHGWLLCLVLIFAHCWQMYQYFVK